MAETLSQAIKEHVLSFYLEGDEFTTREVSDATGYTSSEVSSTLTALSKQPDPCVTLLRQEGSGKPINIWLRTFTNEESDSDIEKVISLLQRALTMLVKIERSPGRIEDFTTEELLEELKSRTKA